MRIVIAMLMTALAISADAALKYGNGETITGLPDNESIVKYGNWHYDTKKQRCEFTWPFNQSIYYGKTFKVVFDANRKVESMYVEWWGKARVGMASGVSSSWEPAPNGKHKRTNWAKEDAEKIVNLLNNTPMLTSEKAKALKDKALASEARKKSLDGID